MNTAPTPAARVYEKIEAKRRRPWQGEEEVRQAWIFALEAELGIHFDAERARKDGSYSNVIIEFKAPGVFKASKASAKFDEAVNRRLLPYIRRDAGKTGIPVADYIGIAIDGEHVCFAQVKGDEIATQHLLPFSEYAVALVIEAIRARTRRAVTAEHLLSDFGHGAPSARLLMQGMADALADELEPARASKVKMLFEEWETLYGQVAGMSVLQADAINGEMGFGWKGPPRTAMAGRLFVIHSYNSLLIKLLAAEIVSAHGLTATAQPAQAMASMKDDAALLDALSSDIEQGAIFSQANLHGFVEEAIFSWYLDVARDPVHAQRLLPALRGVLAALSLYRTDELQHTRDVLRDLYQDLIPGKLRQSLGEFYTPDWLAELTVGKAVVGPLLGRRVLDPTCGSGTFLVTVVRRMRSEADAAGWDAARQVQALCASVWGFDLNPLAVQTARVNFLIEIADLLRKAPGLRLEIPVLLGDAVYSPAPDLLAGRGVMRYHIGSARAGLDIRLPSALASDRERLDRVFGVMAEEVSADREFSAAERRLVASSIVAPDEASEWQHPLKHTYEQILALHRQQWNGIWFRIVRNFFWSANAGHFDYLVGNPPWVRWSKLPQAYRERVKPTCERYDIFSATKYHGGNELDISAIITYAAADKWLKPGGRLAFVLTGTLFKNPSSSGFRKFRLDPAGASSPYLVPVGIDDMKALKPFADASNHTVVAVLDKKDEPGAFPVPYRLWSPGPGTSAAIAPDLPLKEVLSRTSIVDQEAAPVGAPGSPWAVLSGGRQQALKALAGACSWVQGRKGITPDLNGVYYVNVLEDNGGLVRIRSRPDAGKKDIGPPRTGWIEPTLLYPLIKGAGDFEAFYLKRSGEQTLFAIVPNQGIDAKAYGASESLLDSPALAKTKAWFSAYKTLLESRSTYRRQMKGAPFHAVYNVGDYTFRPWKVVWPEMSKRFYAAVAGSAPVPVVGWRPYVPDHKVYFAAFEAKEPAHFLCGLLNAPMVREWIESHVVSIQMGNVFKHLNLPAYDASDAAHAALAAEVERAHAEHDAAARAGFVAGIEKTAEELLGRWMKR